MKIRYVMASAVVALLVMPLAAQAQGVGEGAREGAHEGRHVGHRVVDVEAGGQMRHAALTWSSN